jgi:hypothetical protein
MKTNESSKEVQLIFILCRLAINQLHEPIATAGLKKLLHSEGWKKSSSEDKHKLLKKQYLRDYALATEEQKIHMRKTRDRIEGELVYL